MADKPLGNLVVNVTANVGRFTRGMSSVERSVQRTRSRFASFKTQPLAVAQAIAAIGVAATIATVALTKIGSAVEQTNNRFRRVFGDMSGEVDAFLEVWSDLSGATEAQGRDFAASLGSMLRGMQFTRAEAAALSIQVLKLAGDISAFADVPVAQAVRAITRALAGEREPLKTLSVQYNQVEVDARALEVAMASGTKEITKQHKATAELALLTERMGIQLGTMETEAGDTSTSLRVLSGHLKEIVEDVGLIVSDTFGGALVRLFEKLASIVSGMIDPFADLADSKLLRPSIWVGIAAAAGPLAPIFNAIADASAQAAADALTFANSLDDLTINTEKVREFYRVIQRPPTPVSPIDLDIDFVTAATGRLITENEGLANSYKTVLRGIDGLEENLVAFNLSTHKNLVQPFDASAESAEKAANMIFLVGQTIQVLASIMQSNAGVFTKFRRAIGAIAVAIGSALILGNPVLGASLITGGSLLQLAGGGDVAPGQMALVGEEGPELITGGQSGNTVIPMGGGGGGDIVINLVMDSGRKLVDGIRVKNSRDTDIRRVIRVPVTALATG